WCWPTRAGSTGRSAAGSACRAERSLRLREPLAPGVVGAHDSGPCSRNRRETGRRTSHAPVFRLWTAHTSMTNPAGSSWRRGGSAHATGWRETGKPAGTIVNGVPTSKVLEVAGREVTFTNPDKMVFPEPGHTKLDLVRYYVAVADGALRGVAGRPMILKRFVKGIDQEAFFQKRAPEKRPDWIEVATLRYRSGTSADEVVVRDAAALAWVVNLGCIDLNPHPVQAEDLDHPDELRIDLDPNPGIEW